MITTFNCLQSFDNSLLWRRWIRVGHLHRLITQNVRWLWVMLWHNVRSWLIWMLRHLLWNLILHNARVQTAVNGYISGFIHLAAIDLTIVRNSSITLTWSSLAMRVLNYLVVASLMIKHHGLIYVIIWRLNKGCSWPTCILSCALKIGRNYVLCTILGARKILLLHKHLREL